MNRTILVLAILIVIAIAGCAAEQEGSGGYERPSGAHSGHHH